MTDKTRKGNQIDIGVERITDPVVREAFVNLLEYVQSLQGQGMQTRGKAIANHGFEVGNRARIDRDGNARFHSMKIGNDVSLEQEPNAGQTVRLKGHLLVDGGFEANNIWSYGNIAADGSLSVNEDVLAGGDIEADGDLDVRDVYCREIRTDGRGPVRMRPVSGTLPASPDFFSISFSGLSAFLGCVGFIQTSTSTWLSFAYGSGYVNVRTEGSVMRLYNTTGSSAAFTAIIFYQ